MKKITTFNTCLFVIIFAFLFKVGFGQNENTVIDKLKGKNWYFKGFIDNRYFEKFSTNKVKHCTGNLFTEDEFYLSDSLRLIFSEKKLGHNDVNGKYIYMYANRLKNSGHKLTIFEIIEISDKKLLLKNLDNNQVFELFTQ